jgi:hypothetical protein
LSVRLVSATNPTDGVIVARFSTAMRRDAALAAMANWSCVPASNDAQPITLTDVVLPSRAHPEMVVLRYSGGGSDYTLAVRGVRSAAGELIDGTQASRPLTIGRPGDVEPTIRLFDTVFGPLGMAQRPPGRRTVDQLVANRAIATAVSEQLKQRLASSDGTAGRDGRPGLGRT